MWLTKKLNILAAFVPLVQLILCLWYSGPMWCSAECPDSPCPFGLIMIEGQGLTQPWGKIEYAYFCLFHVKTNCFSSSFLIGLKMNAFISSVAEAHVLRLYYSVLGQIPHLTKELQLALLPGWVFSPLSFSRILLNFSVTRLMNLIGLWWGPPFLHTSGMYG